VQTLDHDEASISIDAAPEVVYALVADVTRTPEFSPEILDCTWLDGATGPAVGARFKATNKSKPKRPSWNNKPVVTVADPGREFAFTRTEPFAGTMLWRYRLEREGDRTPAHRVLHRRQADHSVRLVRHREGVRQSRSPR